MTKDEIICGPNTETDPSLMEANTETDPSLMEANTERDPSLMEANTETDPSLMEANTETDPSLMEANTETDPSLMEANTKIHPSLMEANTETDPSLMEANTETDPSLMEANTETDPSLMEANTETDPTLMEANTKIHPSLMEANTKIHNTTDVEVEGGAQQIKAAENTSENTDEYEYTKRDGFTSEIFKISISNLPKRFGFAELKKKLIQLDLNPVKLKIWKDICYVTFRNEEERETALTKVDGFKWKGRDLKAATARPAADPLIRKRKQEQTNKDSASDLKKSKVDEEELSPSERLKNAVTPLWKLPYEEQLKKKQEEMVNFMRKYLKQIEKNCFDLKSEVQDWRKKFGGMPCELQDIKPSPKTEGYRNKCEFTIGPGVDGQTNVVGFRYGQYSQGTVYVGSPDDVRFLSGTMKTVVKYFQSYLSGSVYKEFNPENHSGHWRQLTVRTSRLGHVMVIIDFHPQLLSQGEIEEEEELVRKYFTEGEGQSGEISSCYFRLYSDRLAGSSTSTQCKLIFGNECITERLLEMEFRISPNSFFQVNTDGAEILYQQVADWCNISPSSTILDVCCGTGTIGLTLAKSVEKVIGIEMCSEAIQDAKINARNNGVENVAYHCCKAEDVMKNVTLSVRSSSDVIAIVDPPRSGLNSSVVVAIRNCRSIRRMVYVSCNVNGALNNLVDLTRPTSKRLKGSRFVPVRAVPVDLFPHTTHCELAILFEREESDQEEDHSD